jgi:hypothetical protein
MPRVNAGTAPMCSQLRLDDPEHVCAPQRRAHPRALALGLLAAIALAGLGGCASLPFGSTAPAAAPAVPPAAAPAVPPAAAPAVPVPPAAVPGTEVTPSDPAKLVEQTDAAIESTRSTVRNAAERLARGVDRWFGDKPFEQGGSVTNGLMTLGVLKRQNESADWTLRFNARFRLPNIEEKTYVFLGRDDERDTITDRPGALSELERTGTRSSQDPSFFGGLGRYFGDAFDTRIGFRGVKPYAQARYRQVWQLPRDGDLEFRETIFWTSKDNLGSTTVLEWDQPFGPELAARWTTAATITQEVRDFVWSSVLGGYRSFGDRRVLALEALISGQQGSGLGPSDYGVQARWSQPLHKAWLLGEVLIGRFWPRKDVLTPREAIWAWGAALKMQF